MEGFAVKGEYEVVDETTLRITELPIGRWTTVYKKFLEDLEQENKITGFTEYHQENRVHFEVDVPKLEQLEDKPGGILKFFKLEGRLHDSNMVAFSGDGKITKYSRTTDIICEYYDQR